MIAAVLAYLNPRRVALFAVAAVVLALGIDDALQRAHVAALRLEIARAETAAAQAIAKAQADARAQEAQFQQQMDEIDQKYQREIQETHEYAANVDRQLADASIRLRKQAACLRVPSPPAAASGGDASPVDGESIAARIVRIGHEADAQLRACQAVIRADRKSTEKK